MTNEPTCRFRFHSHLSIVLVGLTKNVHLVQHPEPRFSDCPDECSADEQGMVWKGMFAFSLRCSEEKLVPYMEALSGAHI